jgi:hypothetical protein
MDPTPQGFLRDPPPKLGLAFIIILNYYEFLLYLENEGVRGEDLFFYYNKLLKKKAQSDIFFALCTFFFHFSN